MILLFIGLVLVSVGLTYTACDTRLTNRTRTLLAISAAIVWLGAIKVLLS